jgi:isopropylmalate/homocitrate/citramalate synthase
VKLEHLKALSDIVAKLTGIGRQPTKAVVGADIFHVEADGAVARLLREDISIDDPGARVVARTYEPKLVGRTRIKVWGRTTLGGEAIREKIKPMRLKYTDARVARVSEEIKRRLAAKPHFHAGLMKKRSRRFAVGRQGPSSFPVAE